MTAVTAVYQGGVLRPAEPLPFADGTELRVSVSADGSAAPPAGPPGEDPVIARLRALHAARGLPLPVVPDPMEAYEAMRRIADLPEEPAGDPTVTGRDHDRVLYGGPGGAR